MEGWKEKSNDSSVLTARSLEERIIACRRRLLRNVICAEDLSLQRLVVFAQHDRHQPRRSPALPVPGLIKAACIQSDRLEPGRWHCRGRLTGELTKLAIGESEQTNRIAGRHDLDSSD
jgi:hypothetical protein